MSPLPVLLRGSFGGWVQPADDTLRFSKNRQLSGQAKGFSSLALIRQRSTASPVGVLRFR
jgi:hypothetical protein